ncbi:MAG: class I SAM-dependent methyltransferase [Robiginitomaculum sp.]|nr:class I SAM-dependent methyltransferase [Robiginitomaculum sp.]
MSKQASPLVIDFTSAAFRHRLKYGGEKGQGLAKAVGLTKGRLPNIIDATAGLGRDGFIMAHLGAEVTMIERSPIVAKALQKALQDARDEESILASSAKRIKLITGDAIKLLANISPQVIYIDPMHPARKKSALVKQNLRDLRQIVGDDNDKQNLIRTALQFASQRVVLKWPKSAELPVDLPKPSYEISGKTTKYYVFICNQ